jgi:hypothetical protein
MFVYKNRESMLGVVEEQSESRSKTVSVNSSGIMESNWYHW